MAARPHRTEVVAVSAEVPGSEYRVPGEAVPIPGSREALAQGCLCPVLDNGHGRGYGRWDGETVFVRRFDCPLHGEPKQEGRR